MRPSKNGGGPLMLFERAARRNTPLRYLLSPFSSPRLQGGISPPPSTPARFKEHRA